MAEGWLERDDAMSAMNAGSRVLVQCIRGTAAREKSYEHDARWLYEFLRDLAHGLWRARIPDPLSVR